MLIIKIIASIGIIWCLSDAPRVLDETAEDFKDLNKYL